MATIFRHATSSTTIACVVCQTSFDSFAVIKLTCAEHIGSWEHANRVKSTLQRLASLDFSGMGVSVAPLFDLEGNAVCFHASSQDPVMLLWPTGTVDYDRVNSLIQLHMGVSLLSVLMGSKLLTTWTWFAFRMQPLFDWMCPTFERCGLADHPRNIVQVSRSKLRLPRIFHTNLSGECQITHHVEIPHLLSQQSSRFSHWLVYNPLDTNARGPRLMCQNAWMQV